MRQIFENVWEVDIRRKNMWFQRKSRTERRKFPRIILLILLACLMFVKLCEGLLSVSRLVAPWSAPQRMMSAPKETIGLQNTWADLWFFLLFPHIFVWGSCFWLCTPACLLLPPAASHTQLTHTQLTRTQLVNTQRAHTQLAHTQLTHTQLSHTHNLPTHNLLAHNLLTKLNHTHNLSTHNLFTHHILTHHILTHNLPTHNWLTHNLLTHNLPTHNLLTHSLLTHNLSTHTHLTRTQLTMLTHDLTTHNLATSTFTSRGRRGTWRHRPSLCVSSTCILRGRCASLCVAGVALGDIDLHFAWQARHSCRRVHATVTNPALITHLLRTVIANSDVECIWRAQTPTIRWHEECIFIKIHTRIITVHVDHTKQQQ